MSGKLGTDSGFSTSVQLGHQCLEVVAGKGVDVGVLLDVAKVAVAQVDCSPQALDCQSFVAAFFGGLVAESLDEPVADTGQVVDVNGGVVGKAEVGRFALSQGGDRIGCWENGCR